MKKNIFILLSCLSFILSALQAMNPMDTERQGTKRKSEEISVSNNVQSRLPWYIKAAHYIFKNHSEKNPEKSSSDPVVDNVKRVQLKKYKPTLNNLKRIKLGLLRSSQEKSAFNQATISAKSPISLKFLQGLTRDNVQLLYSLLDDYPLHLRQDIMENQFPLDVMVEKEFISIIQEVCTQFGLKIKNWDIVNTSSEDAAQVIIKYVDVAQEGHELLPVAIRKGWVTVAEFLADHVRLTDSNKEFIIDSLEEASVAGMIQIIEKLKASGVDINIAHNIVHGASLNILARLIEMGANINAQNNDGYTPLISACINNRIEVVTKLLELKADIHAVDESGNQPIHWAVSAEIIELLKKHGADLEARNNESHTPLMNLSIGNQIEAVKKLIECKVQIDATDLEGLQAIHYAESAEMVDIFVKAGANIEAKSSSFASTPLLFNCYDGKLEVFKELVKLGANIQALDVDGMQCIHRIAFKNHLEHLKYLIEQLKIPVNTPSQSRPARFPIHYAAAGLARDCLAYLLGKVEVYVQDDAEFNILTQAIDRYLDDDEATEEEIRAIHRLVLDHVTQSEFFDPITHEPMLITDPKTQGQKPIVFDNKDNYICHICRDKPSDRFTSPYCMHVICHNCKDSIRASDKCHICKKPLESQLLNHPKFANIRNEFF